jgi:aminoglycoside 6-adenylyltransferase
MRTEQAMMKLILDKAQADERIRAVFLNGSRADEQALHDQYCDYDIVYVVRDIRSFTGDDAWLGYFGEMLILQKPTDWYSHPYDYAGTDNFTYLMQFADGTRIDLTLIDVARIATINAEVEPRIILLDKDGRPELYDIPAGTLYHIQRPSAKEYFDTCNEFWWLAVVVAKGICRGELFYVKAFMEHYQMEMFLKMLLWQIGIAHDFQVSGGKCQRYVQCYLTADEMNRFRQLYPNGDFENIKAKLSVLMGYFAELAPNVAAHFGFEYKAAEAQRVQAFVCSMLGLEKDTVE